jgi:hypothetical protein
MKVEWKRDILLKKAKNISLRYNVPNPISGDSSLTVFNQTFSGDSIKVAVTDSLSSIWDQFNESNFAIKLLNAQIENMTENRDIEEKRNDRDFISAVLLPLILGGIFLLIGRFGMMSQEEIQNKILKSQIKEAETNYSRCQSCAKLFSPIRARGKEADGTKSLAFCIECYDNGSYTEPALTHDQFLNRLKHGIRHRARIIRWIILKFQVPSLLRWKKDEYS